MDCPAPEAASLDEVNRCLKKINSEWGLTAEAKLAVDEMVRTAPPMGAIQQVRLTRILKGSTLWQLLSN